MLNSISAEKIIGKLPVKGPIPWLNGKSMPTKISVLGVVGPRESDKSGLLSLIFPGEVFNYGSAGIWGKVIKFSNSAVLVLVSQDNYNACAFLARVVSTLVYVVPKSDQE